MGKSNGNSWLNAVKKAFRSPTNDGEKRSSRIREENEQEEEEKKRGKRRWIFRKHSSIETTIQHNVAKGSNSSAVIVSTNTQSGGENLVAAKVENSSLSDSDQRRRVATAQQAAVDTIRLSRSSLFVKQHCAAVLIQTIFRGYLARRALLALKGVVKLQALIRGYNVRKRAKMTLQCIQSLVRVQSLVCDQRRRLSCEATNSISRNGNRLSCNLDGHPHSVDEIQALIQKAEECSIRQRNTLANILSHQIRTLEKDQFSDNNNNYQELEEEEEEENRFSGRKRNHIPGVIRKDMNLCIRKDPIKTVEIDTYKPYFYTSPKTPSSSKMDSIQVHSCSPCHKTGERNYQTAETPTSRSIYLHRMSMSESSSCSLPQPSYMAATASAMARVRSVSTPRQRPLSPRRDQPGSSAKKRLSFPVPDADEKLNMQRYNKGQMANNVPCYYTE